MCVTYGAMSVASVSHSATRVVTVRTHTVGVLVVEHHVKVLQKPTQHGVQFLVLHVGCELWWHLEVAHITYGTTRVQQRLAVHS